METLIEPLVVGGLTLTRRGLLIIDRRKVKLTPRQADLLAYLMLAPGCPYRPERLMVAVWGDGWGQYGSLVRMTVRNINNRAGRRIIENRWGWGYFMPADKSDG